MNGRRILISGALVLLASCSSVTTHIDYDREADLDGYRTFAWAPNSTTSMAETSPLMHQRLVDYVTQKLQEGGMSEVAEAPDLFVTYHTSEKKEVKVNSSSMGYDYGPDFYYDPYWAYSPGMVSTTVHTYVKGSLIFEAWDAESDRLVWRGTVESVVPENPQKEEKKIYEAIDALVKDWRKMRG